MNDPRPPRSPSGTFADGAPGMSSDGAHAGARGPVPPSRPRAEFRSHVDVGVPQKDPSWQPHHGEPMPGPHRPLPTPMVRMVEGLRGISTRTAVYLRYVASFLGVVLCSSLTQWAMSDSGGWRNGGIFMFWSALLMVVTAAVGSWFYANHRNEIIEQLKHYLFGIALIPGTALSLINRAAAGLFASPSGQSDAFLSATANALPLLVFITVVIPAALFVKMVAGMRHLHRSRLDDEEAMLTYTRNDGWMR